MKYRQVVLVTLAIAFVGGIAYLLWARRNADDRTIDLAANANRATDSVEEVDQQPDQNATVSAQEVASTSKSSNLDQRQVQGPAVEATQVTAPPVAGAAPSTTALLQMYMDNDRQSLLVNISPYVYSQAKGSAGNVSPANAPAQPQASQTADQSVEMPEPVARMALANDSADPASESLQMYMDTDWQWSLDPVDISTNVSGQAKGSAGNVSPANHPAQPQASQITDQSVEIPEPVARMALADVGADPFAEMIWMSAINDPQLSPQDRQNLIEDLNEEGFADPQNITADDLPLIVSRMEFIEDLLPNAMDEVNLAAFSEAYSDLEEMYNKVINY